MRYLIDSNIFLFSVLDNGRLTNDTKSVIKDYGNNIYISSESVKEMIYLLQSKKITVKQWKKPEDVIDFITNGTGFEIKYVKEEHLRTLANLPFFSDHKDPSDRIIIAHAITEKIPLISSDKKFFLYKNSGLEFIFNEC
ncbi:MAG: type II toxin-antitoxin system VapC family toxin [Chitinivibrionia bacterium]|nr:type II toxin-antitoxin system VapC family toxin [Chitinivibrionia bacterium]